MNNCRGSILTATLIFILVFTLFGFSSIYLATMQNEAAERRTASTKAFWLAETGIQKALGDYNKNQCQSFYKKNSNSSTCSAVQCTDCKCGGVDKCLSQQLSTTDMDGKTYTGKYDVIFDCLNSNVISTGTYPLDVNTPIYSQRKIELDSGAPTYAKYAVFGKQKVTFESTVLVDSVVSGLCGNVGTNGTAPASVYTGTLPGASGGTNIIGNVSTGPGASSGPNDTIQGSGGITGDKSRTNNVNIPTIPPPSLIYQDFSTVVISNNTTLPSGNYRYRGINLSTPGVPKVLTIDGNVNLYLSGSNNLIAFFSKIELTAGSSIKIYTNNKFNFWK